MITRGKKVFTGAMQLFEGWEIRPFAVMIADGLFSPGLSARRHQVGHAIGRVFSFDFRCANKEEAFELALSQGRNLIHGELTPAA